ncbi:hypothetical protein [Roseiconus lacunae]|uniref:MotA/TolQ/ExbB proton channel domain-containing protein n=1 Tax=Roseiconus lacunae TaxID=2605694 RepID=A0ABT7PK97_9BACT|nr:hypothetical protein [Roseiconus lacunae]MDM4016706.1 hypothetical protein [Roseiconus lacunae]
MNDSPTNPYLSDQSAPGVGGQESIEATAKIGMIITFSLATGILFITGILTYMTLRHLPDDAALVRLGGDDLLFLVVGFGIMLAALPAALVVPRLMRKQAFNHTRISELNLPRPIRPETELPAETRPVLGAIMGSVLVGQAICEGSAITNAILMMINENFAHLVPVVIGFIGVIVQIPTTGKIVRMIEDAAVPR